HITRVRAYRDAQPLFVLRVFRIGAWGLLVVRRCCSNVFRCLIDETVRAVDSSVGYCGKVFSWRTAALKVARWHALLVKLFRQSRMELAVLLPFITASLVLALVPGPDNIFVLTQSAVYGWNAGILVVLGLCTGLLV